MTASPPIFYPQTTYAIGTSPQSVAVGDVNGDGKLDLVSANSGSNNVSVLLGNGDGTFQTQSAYASGQGTGAIALGDVNGDGRLDAVTATVTGNQPNVVSVLLGNGDGTFQSPVVSPSAYPFASSTVLADLNGDGRLDVVEMNRVLGVTVMLGNGDGHFGAPRTITFSGLGDPEAMAVGDLNGDGRPDIVVGLLQNRLAILSGNGDGTFQAPHLYTTPSINTDVAIADVNLDGKADLVGGNALYLGNGDGTFTLGMYTVAHGLYGDNYPWPISFPISDSVVDVNGDGLPDGVISGSVALNNGDGTFQQLWYAVGQGAGPSAVADLNGDGRPDMVVPNSADNTLSVLINTGPTRVLSVAASQASGVVQPDDTVTFTVSVNRAVTVAGGTPKLMLNDGGVASYDAVATAALGDPSKMVFTYTVAPSDLSTSGLSFVRGDLNGAAIADQAGVVPDFSAIFTASFPNLEVATPPTAVTSIATSPSGGIEYAGDTVTFTLAFNRAVAVTGGTPTLTLNDNGIAIYDAAATAALGDPTRMVFSYTIGASDLPVNGLSIVRGDQNGAVIADAKGQGPDFSSVFATSFSSIQIDTPATVVTSVVASLASGADQPGDTVTFTITMNRAVTVTGGTPTLTLNDGGIAVYDAAASAALGDPTKMVFSYTVGVSDLPADGLSFVRGDQNGAVIVDAAGRGPDFSGVFNTAFSEVHIEPTLPGVQTVGAVFQVADGLAHEMGSMTTAELASGNFAAAWVIDGVLHTQIFDSSGARLGSESTAPTLTATPPPSSTGPVLWTTFPVSISGLANGGFVVALDIWAPTGEIETHLFDANGAPIGVFQPGSGTHLTDATALSNGEFVVTWSDSLGSKAQVFGANGTKIGDEILLPGPARMLGLAGGNFVAFSSDASGLSAQIFDAQGNKIGAEFEITSATTGTDGSVGNASMAALPTGGFVVSWDVDYAYASLNDNVIEAQQFDAGGAKIGAQLQVNTDYQAHSPDGPDSYEPTVAALAGGNFVVTWADRSGSFGSYVTSVRAQLFDSYQQQRVGTELVVDTINSQGLVFPASQVVGSQDGGFIVTWSDGTSEKGQVYAANQPVTTIAAGTTLEIPAASSAKLAFTPGGASLQLDQSTAFTGAITGFGAGDGIDLADIAFSGAGTTLGYAANTSNSGGHLAVSDGTHIAALTLLGQYGATSFVLSADGHGGTLVSAAASDTAGQPHLAAAV